MNIVYRLKYEDHDLEPIDHYDVFHEKLSALAAFGRVLTEPDYDLGSVYLTADDCDGEGSVIAWAYLR